MLYQIFGVVEIPFEALPIYPDQGLPWLVLDVRDGRRDVTSEYSAAAFSSALTFLPLIIVRYKVLTAARTKMALFWDVSP
jgi:hypothetical protein